MHNGAPEGYVVDALAAFIGGHLMQGHCAAWQGRMSCWLVMLDRNVGMYWNMY